MTFATGKSMSGEHHLGFLVKFQPKRNLSVCKQFTNCTLLHNMCCFKSRGCTCTLYLFFALKLLFCFVFLLTRAAIFIPTGENQAEGFWDLKQMQRDLKLVFSHEHLVNFLMQNITGRNHKVLYK